MAKGNTYSNLNQLLKDRQQKASQDNYISSDKKINSSIVTNEILLDAAKELQQAIQKRLQDYYTWSDSKGFRYEKSGDLLNSLRCQTKVISDASGRHISIYFDKQLDRAKSFFNPIWNQVGWQRSLLINDGWHVSSDVWFSDIEHFGYYEGFHFIEEGIKDWMRKSKYAKYITVMRNGHNGELPWYDDNVDYF